MNAQWDEIEKLVRLAQEGDRDAFGELVNRFRVSVEAYARRRTRDEHEAQELAQEVFLHALRKIKQLREPAAFGAWLRKITARIAINRGTRRPAMATASNEVLELEARSTASPLDEVMLRERRDAVRDAVGSLRSIDREALHAFYLNGKSLKEIADEFEIPVGTVKRRLHVARKRLQEAMELEPVGAGVVRDNVATRGGFIVSREADLTVMAEDEELANVDSEATLVI